MAVYQVTKIIHFCYGHRLLHYDGMCRHPHGHNGKVEITLESPKLDHRGMVVDFSDISKRIKTWIDKTLDHRMILNREDSSMIEFLKREGEPFVALNENPTAENIAKFIFEYASAEGFPVKRVTLWESESSFAVFENKKSKKRDGSPSENRP
ncbi:MAG: 6-carboxytetrahydropterin synthase [Candidatus Omnitrophica bacterium]|nr:6-carboxytetrahydropterin synthase [Candidatus Omnitrophota bacterium]